jgi:hypothetical protein
MLRLSGGQYREAALAGTINGWEWWDEGKSKWGWWTNSSHPGASITLQISTMPELGGMGSTPTDFLQPVMLAFGCLRSGTKPMGRAKVSCVAGCTCESIVLRGFWDRKVSLTYVHALRVTQHDTCQVHFEVQSSQ